MNHSEQLGQITNVHTAQDRLLAEMKDWAESVYKRHKNTPWKGVHDEGTFLTAFREYYAFTHDEQLYNFVFEMLESANKWMDEHLYHGYWKRAEVHHGVEHFTILLAWLHELNPQSSIVIKQLKKASQHLIKQGRKRRPWYRFEEQKFTGMHLGSKSVRNERLNLVEHLRLVRMGWLGHAVSPDPRYKRLILEYSEKWANEIVEATEVPIYLDDQGESWWTRFLFKKVLNTFIGAAPKETTPITRSEIHIANGTPALFLRLYELTQKKIYLEAVQKILEPLQHQLGSPYAHPVGELLWQTSQFVEIPELKYQVSQIWAPWKEFDWSQLSISFNRDVNWKETDFHNTIGIRNDMPALVYQGLPSGIKMPPSPSTFGLIYRVTGDPQALVCALDIAHAVLKLGKQTYPDGRNHGCGSTTVSACCIGHGRNWGAGYVSTALRAAKGPNCFNIKLPQIDL